MKHSLHGVTSNPLVPNATVFLHPRKNRHAPENGKRRSISSRGGAIHSFFLLMFPLSYLDEAILAGLRYPTEEGGRPRLQISQGRGSEMKQLAKVFELLGVIAGLTD